MVHRFYHVPASNTAVGHLYTRKRGVKRGRECHLPSRSRWVGRRGFRPQASRRHQADRRGRGGFARRPRARQDEEAAAKYGVGHVTTDLADSLKTALASTPSFSATPTQMHVGAGDPMLGSGQARPGGDSACRQFEGRRVRPSPCRSEPGSSRWPVTPAASIRATSLSTRKFWPVRFASTKWTYRPISSAAPT